MHYPVFGRGNADLDSIGLAPHGVPEQHFGRNGIRASSGETVVQLDEGQSFRVGEGRRVVQVNRLMIGELAKTGLFENRERCH
jgi:hypothetical protein